MISSQVRLFHLVTLCTPWMLLFIESRLVQSKSGKEGKLWLEGKTCARDCAMACICSLSDDGKLATTSAKLLLFPPSPRLLLVKLILLPLLISRLTFSLVLMEVPELDSSTSLLLLPNRALPRVRLLKSVDVASGVELLLTGRTKPPPDSSPLLLLFLMLLPRLLLDPKLDPPQDEKLLQMSVLPDRIPSLLSTWFLFEVMEDIKSMFGNKAAVFS